ncbi:hypothetical protein, partial [Nocardia brasiliensis]|uniref:hypothetical protein n=1 Tax=Nocardia brasiliensis TaxID=37326 RepID=UPI002457A1F9
MATASAWGGGPPHTARKNPAGGEFPDDGDHIVDHLVGEPGIDADPEGALGDDVAVGQAVRDAMRC